MIPVQPRVNDRVTMRSPTLIGVAVPAGAVGFVVAVLPTVPIGVRVAWDNGKVSELLHGIDDFTLFRWLKPCPECGNDDRRSLAIDTADASVICECGAEYRPDDQ